MDIYTARADIDELFEIMAEALASAEDAKKRGDIEAESDAFKLVMCCREKLDQIQEDVAEKIEWMVKSQKNAEAEAKALKAEADNLTKRARTAQRKADSIKSFIQYTMDHFGIMKITAGIFKVWQQKNGQRSVKLNCKPEDLPKEYQKITVEADNTAIKDAIKRGVESELFELAPETFSLRIK